MSESTTNVVRCEGICLTGYDIGIPGSGIAYPHPDCPAHGDDWVPWDNEWSRQYVADHPERFTTQPRNTPGLPTPEVNR